jgi:hypothetical protein
MQILNSLTLFGNGIDISRRVYAIYCGAIADYHIKDDVGQPVDNPFSEHRLEHLFYQKCWIDTVQWHLEDQIRAIEIDPHDALRLKRRIDKLNQERTDVVEKIDTCIMKVFESVLVPDNTPVNTESPGWALDRLSILALKIYHMEAEVGRSGGGNDHIEKCTQKLEVLNLQRETLSGSIDQLLLDIANGNRRMRLYKQMKMYNDATLNPVLYKNSK